VNCGEARQQEVSWCLLEDYCFQMVMFIAHRIIDLERQVVEKDHEVHVLRQYVQDAVKIYR